MQNSEEQIKEEPMKTPSKMVLSIFDWLESLSVALIILSVIFTLVIRVPEVWGPSMLPTLHENDRLLISCLDRNFHQYDVVIVDEKGTSLGERIVKRVIATEGQIVDIDFDTGTVFVDGEPIDESAYIQSNITTDSFDVEFPQQVPEGCVFVLGDNRTVSLDSRDSRVGMIDCRNIIGKADFIIFPFSHFGKIPK